MNLRSERDDLFKFKKGHYPSSDESYSVSLCHCVKREHSSDVPPVMTTVYDACCLMSQEMYVYVKELSFYCHCRNLCCFVLE